jgi:predicted metalloendopeptidase
VRANAAAANLDGYAATFGCAPGDPMRIESPDRVSIW